MTGKQGSVWGLLVLAVTGLFGPGDTRAYETTPAADGWESYADAIELDAASAVGMLPGQGSAEAALLHFYASLLRRDVAHLDVVPPEGHRHPGYPEILASLSLTDFERVRLLARKAEGEGSYRIRLHLEGSVAGEAFSGEDEALLQLIGGLWYLTQPPI